MVKKVFSRPDKYTYFLELAAVVAKRGTCARRQVGCVLVDVQNKVRATGYNGVYKGAKHCIDNPCMGVDAPSGQDLWECRAVHAEANALIQCQTTDVPLTAYVTCLPCAACARMLVNGNVKTVVISETYPSDDSLEIFHGADVPVLEFSFGTLYQINSKFPNGGEFHRTAVDYDYIQQAMSHL